MLCTPITTYCFPGGISLVFERECHAGSFDHYRKNNVLPSVQQLVPICDVAWNIDRFSRLLCAAGKNSRRRRSFRYSFVTAVHHVMKKALQESYFLMALTVTVSGVSLPVFKGKMFVRLKIIPVVHGRILRRLQQQQQLPVTNFMASLRYPGHRKK